MKKYFIVSTLMLLLPFMGYALKPSQLSGTYSNIGDDSDSASELFYLFNEDGTFQASIEGKMCYIDTYTNSMESTLLCFLETKIEGKFKIEGSQITLISESKETTISFSVKSEYENTQTSESEGNQNPSYLVKGIDDMAKKINSDFIPQMKKEASQPQTHLWTNVKLTSTSLSFEYNGIKYTLTKD